LHGGGREEGGLEPLTVLEFVARARHGGGGVGAELAGVERESAEWRGRRSRGLAVKGIFFFENSERKISVREYS
jgi:hypothetical protein